MKAAATIIRIIKRIAFLKIRLKLTAFKIKIDAIIAGNVKRSPNAAMIGLVILSGSHPCSKLLNETNIVIGSIIKFEMTPANTQISIKSITDIDG